MDDPQTANLIQIAVMMERERWTMEPTCEACPGAAIGLFTWGMYPNGEHSESVPLCEAHSKELWDKVNGAVASGLCHYQIKPLGSGL